MGKKVINIIVMVLIFSIFSSCSKNGNIESDLKNGSESYNTTEADETAETHENCEIQIYSIRYNKDIYVNIDMSISNMGAEWIEEYTGFVYLGEVKYSENYDSEADDFTTNIKGENFKIYQCNEDCSIIAGCMSDNNVVVFRLGSMTQEEFDYAWNNTMWRDKGGLINVIQSGAGVFLASLCI